MKVCDYVSSVFSASEQKQQESSHRMLISCNSEASQKLDQTRFNEIIKQIYNIDRLLSKYGLGLKNRPQVDYLVEIIFRAANGDLSKRSCLRFFIDTQA